MKKLIITMAAVAVVLILGSSAVGVYEGATLYQAQQVAQQQHTKLQAETKKFKAAEAKLADTVVQLQKAQGDYQSCLDAATDYRSAFVKFIAAEQAWANSFPYGTIDTTETQSLISTANNTGCVDVTAGS